MEQKICYFCEELVQTSADVCLKRHTAAIAKRIQKYIHYLHLSAQRQPPYFHATSLRAHRLPSPMHQRHQAPLMKIQIHFSKIQIQQQQHNPTSPQSLQGNEHTPAQAEHYLQLCLRKPLHPPVTPHIQLYWYHRQMVLEKTVSLTPQRHYFEEGRASSPALGILNRVLRHTCALGFTAKSFSSVIRSRQCRVRGLD